VTFSRAGFIFLTPRCSLSLDGSRRAGAGSLSCCCLLLVLTLNVDGFIARLGTIGDVQTDGSGRERWETIGKPSPSWRPTR